MAHRGTGKMGPGGWKPFSPKKKKLDVRRGKLDKNAHKMGVLPKSVKCPNLQPLFPGSHAYALRGSVVIAAIF